MKWCLPKHWVITFWSSNPTPRILLYMVVRSWASCWAVDGDGDLKLSCPWAHYLYLVFLLSLSSASLVFSSTSSMSSCTSSFRFPSTAIMMWLRSGLTLLILLQLAISDDGSALIITLLWIMLLATKIWHYSGHVNLSKFASVLEGTSKREICWKSGMRCLGKHLWGVYNGGHSHYSATQARCSSPQLGV